MLKRPCLYLLSAWALAFILPTSAFAQSEKKTAYSVLLDNTRSLEKQLQQVLMLGKGVVKRIHESGPVSLFSFISKPDNEGGLIMDRELEVFEGSGLAVATFGAGWSQDESTLDRYIDSLSVVKGQTTLFEAIHAIAEELKGKVNSNRDTLRDKVIILITDGDQKIRLKKTFWSYPDDEDYERKKQLGHLINELKEAGIKVYAIGLVRDLNIYGGSRFITKREKAESLLKKITKETGGRVVFPKSKKINVETLLSELLTK